jgi:hypothetical protein
MGTLKEPLSNWRMYEGHRGNDDHYACKNELKSIDCMQPVSRDFKMTLVRATLIRVHDCCFLIAG